MSILYQELYYYNMFTYYLSFTVIIPLFIIIHFEYMKYFLTNHWKPQNAFMRDITEPILEEVRTLLNINVSSKHCPRNHPLTIEATDEDNYYCNLCLAPYSEGTMMYSCRQCDYDECFNCYNIISKKEAFVHDPDSIGNLESDVESADETETDDEVEIQPPQ